MILAVIWVFGSFVATNGETVGGPQCPAVEGIIPLYIPDEDCTKFWECSNGTPYQFDCPGGLHFNPTINACDWPHQAGCKGSDDNGSNEATTESSNNDGEDNGDDNENSDGDQICLELDAECPAVDGEHSLYFPLPNNCDQFCQCSHGRIHLHNCPEGLHFNPILNVCDYSEQAGCDGGNGSNGTGETTTESNNNDGENDGDSNEAGDATTESSNNDGDDNQDSEGDQICLELGAECPAIDGEHSVYYPLPNNCDQFCQCSHGRIHLHNCPEGLHFNPILNVCDYPEDAGCDGGNDSNGTDETTTEGNNNDGDNDGDSNEAGDATTESSNNDGDDNDDSEGDQICLELDAECPAIDGEHSLYYPLPNNCDQFCQCSHGRIYLHNCPEGLHFNPILNVCDYPEDAGCDGGNDSNGTDETTTEGNNNDGDNDGDSNEAGDATTESSNNDGDDNQDSEGDEICLELGAECPAIDGEHSVYYPLPNNCDQFCQCSHGRIHLHNCPEGLHFNPILNVCDYPEDAGCDGGNGSNGTDETTTEGNNNDGDNDGDSNEAGDATTESSNNDGDDNDDSEGDQICLELDAECPAIDGEHSLYFPLPNNCDQFCQCSHGRIHLHNCPEGLHFNPILNVCDYPEDAGCDGGNGSNGTDDTTTEGNNNDDDNDGDGNEAGEATTESSNNDGDDNQDSEGDQICLELGAECPAIDGEHSLYFPLPNNCDQFCQCSHGRIHLHNCPEGLHFNPILNVCDYPEDAGCDGGNGSNGTGETTTEGNNNDDDNDGDSNEAGDATTESSNNDGDDNQDSEGDQICLELGAECPAIDGEHSVYYPLPNNCDQFCQCSHGRIHLHNCPDGLHFNPILNVCDYPEDAGCDGGNGSNGTDDTTTEGNNNDDDNDGDGNEAGEATTESSNNDGDDNQDSEGDQICLELGAECPAIDGEHSLYFPLPNNCDQFCQCSHGRIHLHNCPEGLHFNPILNVCDYPEDAGCDGGNGSNGTDDTTTEGNNNDDDNDGDGNEAGEATTESSNNDGDDNQDSEGDQICLELGAECPAIDGEHSLYFPLPNNCDQFCQCSHGRIHLHNCPEGLHFNPILNVCDYPEHAGCDGGNGSNETGETTTEGNNNDGDNDGDSNEAGDATTESSNNDGDDNQDSEGDQICLKLGAECPAIDGEHSLYYPLPNNCDQFCQCSHGGIHLHNCPEGLHFNPILNVCDYPEHAGCDGGNGSNETGETTTEGNNNDGDNDGDSNEAGDATTESSNNDGDDNDDSEGDQICLELEAECPAIDGEHSLYFPLPNNCDQFCQCSHGRIYLHNCPEGLHFNPTLNVCDYPEHAGCDGGNGSNGTDETTTEGNNNDGDNDGDSNEAGDATTESSNNDGDDNDDSEGDQICLELDAECPAIDGEHSLYYPLPNNCDQFCQCSHGRIHLHNCPEGLHFNPTLNVCDYPEHAGCDSGNGSNGTGETTTEGNNNDDDNDGDGNEAGDATTESSNNDGDDNDDSDGDQICLELGAECPAIDGEHSVYYPLPNNCDQFCQCSHGRIHLHNCPAGLHFNPILNVCDYSEQAGCDGGNGSNGNGDTTTESNNNDDDNDGDGNEAGEATTESSNNDGDDNQDSEGDQICLELDAECPAIDGEHSVYYPLPNNCDQFCQCSHGRIHLHNCPEGLHFNPILNVCDHSEEAGCDGGNGSNGTDETTTEGNNNNGDNDGDSNEAGDATTESSNNDGDDNQDSEGDQICLELNAECPAIDGEHSVYYPLPNNCNQFCQCSHGRIHLHSCPEGLHFNPILNVCDHSEQAGCDGGNGSNGTDETTTEGNNNDGDNDGDSNEAGEATTESSNNDGGDNGDGNEDSDGNDGDQICLELDTDCPAVDGEYPVYLPLPNCENFCQCSNGKPYLYNCPIGQHFNPVLNICDWPEDAQCGLIPN